MRILFISHEATRTGAPLALLQVLRTLKKDVVNFAPEIILLGDGPMMSDFYSIGRVYDYCKLSIFQRALLHFFPRTKYNRLIRRISRKNYDCIYANTVVSMDAAIEIKHQLKVPLIAHIHESDYMLWSLGMTEDKLKECDYIIAVSEKTKDTLVQTYHAKEEKITIQHPISPLLANCVNNNQSFNASNENNSFFTIGLSGSGCLIKGFDTLPILVKVIKSRYPQLPFKIEVVGDVPIGYQRMIQKDLQMIGDDDIVSFNGLVSNPLSKYKSFDVVLILSREESFSLAAEECAFVGTPIILYSKTTGAAEWLDEDSCIAVPYMDFGKMADAIFLLYSDAEKRKFIADNAQRKVISMCRADMRMTGVQKVLRDVVQK